MKNCILIIGAGLSSKEVIRLAYEESPQDWTVVVTDQSQSSLERHVPEGCRSLVSNIDSAQSLQQFCLQHDINPTIIISLLPAQIHPVIAEYCVKHRCHLVTPSAAREEMWAQDDEAKKNGITLLNEIGVDPGIGDMLVMDALDRVQLSGGGKVHSQVSCCGGLPADPNANDWGYLFFWNPKNVVNAGKTGATHRFLGRDRQVTYQDIFESDVECTARDSDLYEDYFNRDALKYLKRYGLDDIQNFSRRTLRYAGYNKFWQTIIKLGLTSDEAFEVPDKPLTKREWLFSTLAFTKQSVSYAELEASIARILKVKLESSLIQQLAGLGLFSEEVLFQGPGTTTNAELLEKVLRQYWTPKAGELDRVVLVNTMSFFPQGKEELRTLTASLDIVGDATTSAMAKTVGVPLWLATKAILEGKITSRGVVLPIYRSIYGQILPFLNDYGINIVHDVSNDGE